VYWLGLLRIAISPLRTTMKPLSPCTAEKAQQRYNADGQFVSNREVLLGAAAHDDEATATLHSRMTTQTDNLVSNKKCCLGLLRIGISPLRTTMKPLSPCTAQAQTQCRQLCQQQVE
jgi:hypothetical protein